MNYKNILILIIILLIIILLILLTTNTIEYFESKQKIWAMTFGGGEKNYYDATNRLTNELNKTNIFNKIVTYSDIDLKNDTNFWNTHGEFIENNKRGYGYWLWKPYLIMKILEQMDENDILFHLDAGCEITDYSENAIELLKKTIENCNKHNMLYTNTWCKESLYTKMDIFKYMNLIDKNVMNSHQHQATYIIVKKNNITVDFMKDWYNISCNYNLINDDPSFLPNDKLFIDNRHTQSTFSLLIKSDKYKELNTKNNTIDSYPVLLSRKRSG